MRTAKIDICGKEYLLCFSARVVRAVTERYGGMERIDEALSGKDGTDAEPSAVKALDEAVWLLAAMMNGGERYAKLNGLPNPHALTADELLDVMDIGDFARLREKIAETITNGKEAHVEAEPPKNAETTSEAQ